MPPALIVLGILLLLGVFWMLRRVAFRARRRKLLAQPMPDEWDAILRENFPLYLSMPADLRDRLGGYVNAFLAEKNFEACGDLEAVTEEMRVTLAGQACVLLLNGRFGVFDRLRTVLLYPNVFVGESGVDRDGVDRGEQSRLGESWGTGSVVFSWRHVLHGPEYVDDGHNVVLHEFAHQLDQEDGAADGVPSLGSSSAHREWAAVFREAYEQHANRRRRGRRLVIDDYGATNPAEFFAVATETFIEKPEALKERYPALYEQLCRFYELDPVAWEESSAGR